MTPTPKPVKKLDGTEKLIVEMGPLMLFLAGLFFAKKLAPPIDEMFGITYFSEPGRELFLAMALFLPAFMVAFGYSIIKTKRAAPILIITAVLTGVMGSLTFLLDSKTFIYMKPTIVYGLMAAVLAGGLLTGRIFLKVLFDGAFELNDSAWRTLTWRFVAFNACAALANEILWRTLTIDCVVGEVCAGEKTWGLIKVFGFMGAYLIFILAHTPFLMKHMKTEEQTTE